MNNKLIYGLASKGKFSDEPETKDLIFSLIMALSTGDYKLPVDIDKTLPVKNVLKDYLYKRSDYVKLSEEAIKEAKNKYGTYNGYSKLQLALDFFQMSNDLIFAVYGFNYVPKGKVRDAAVKLIEIQNTMNVVSSGYVTTMYAYGMIDSKTVNTVFKNECMSKGSMDISIQPEMTISSDINESLMKSILDGGISKSMMNDAFKPGC